MSSLNRVMLLGNLTRDPEIRQTAKGQAVGDLNLAINRTWTDSSNERYEEVTFVDVTVWGRTAENVAKFLTKGRAVFVEGRLHLDTWKDADTGQNRTKLKVVAERVQFIGNQAGAAGASNNGHSADNGHAAPTNGSRHHTPPSSFGDRTAA